MKRFLILPIAGILKTCRFPIAVPKPFRQVLVGAGISAIMRSRLKTRHVMTSLALGIMVLVPTGCKQTSTIDGQVFIVTQSAAIIRLADVPIELIPLNELQSVWSNRLAVLSNKCAELEVSVHKRSLTYTARHKRLTAEINRLENEYTTFITNETISTYSECSSNEALWASIQRNLSYQYDHIAKLNSISIEQRNNLRRLLEQNQLVTAETNTPEFFSYHSPSPFFATKTDVNGAFQIKMLSSKPYVLLASASRNVGDTKETYYWVVSLDYHQKMPRQIILSNDNLYHGGTQPSKP